MQKLESLIKIVFKPYENNKDFMDVHINKKISESRIEILRSGGINDFKKIGKLGEKLVHRLLNIEGITSIYLHPYDMSIEKAKLFDWEELNPIIEKVIQFTIQEYIPNQKEINEVLEEFDKFIK